MPPASELHKITGERLHEWQRAMRSKIEALHLVHPHWRYTTASGGWRLIWSLPGEGFEVHDCVDAEVWSTAYVEWCEYLRGVHGLDTVDPSCRDVSRFFRLPRAHFNKTTKTYEPQVELTEGEIPPTWSPELSAGAWERISAVRELAATRARTPRAQGKAVRGGREMEARAGDDYSIGEIAGETVDEIRDDISKERSDLCAGDGVLGRLFEARGWVHYERGSKMFVICPWSTDGVELHRQLLLSSPTLNAIPEVEPTESHDSGDSTSTFVGAPLEVGGLGTWKCSHATCLGRAWKDVLSRFTNDELLDAGYRFDHARASAEDEPVVLDVDVVRPEPGSLKVRRFDDRNRTGILAWHLEEESPTRYENTIAQWRLLSPSKRELVGGMKARIRIEPAFARTRLGWQPKSSDTPKEAWPPPEARERRMKAR